MLVFIENAHKEAILKKGNTRKIYFAHPINVYHTELEQTLLALIKQKWRDDDIINPSDEQHESVVRKLKAHDQKANVMGYFTELVRTCDEVVALPFTDGKWGKGVYTEAETVLDVQNGKYVWVIDPQTHDIRFVPMLDPALCLSVEETRARIRHPDGNIKPYA